jgi:hypothetical protein
MVDCQPTAWPLLDAAREGPRVPQQTDGLAGPESNSVHKSLPSHRPYQGQAEWVRHQPAAGCSAHPSSTHFKHSSLSLSWAPDGLQVRRQAQVSGDNFPRHAGDCADADLWHTADGVTGSNTPLYQPVHTITAPLHLLQPWPALCDSPKHHQYSVRSTLRALSCRTSPMSQHP